MAKLSGTFALPGKGCDVVNQPLEIGAEEEVSIVMPPLRRYFCQGLKLYLFLNESSCPFVRRS